MNWSPDIANVHARASLNSTFWPTQRERNTSRNHLTLGGLDGSHPKAPSRAWNISITANSYGSGHKVASSFWPLSTSNQRFQFQISKSTTEDCIQSVALKKKIKYK